MSSQIGAPAAAAGNSRTSPRLSSLRKRPAPAPAPSPSEVITPNDQPSTELPLPASKKHKAQTAEEATAIGLMKGTTGKSNTKQVSKKKKPARPASKTTKTPNKKKAPSSASSTDKKKNLEEEEEESPTVAEEEDVAEEATSAADLIKPRKAVPRVSKEAHGGCFFLGDPIPLSEAKKNWPQRYQRKEAPPSSSRRPQQAADEDMDDKMAISHYRQANVEDNIYNLLDDVYVQAAEGEDNYIGRIIEFFLGSDRKLYFTAQWFFRTKDTVIKDQSSNHDDRRLFFSEERNVNLLDCLISKIQITRVTPDINLAAKVKTLPPCGFYFDMSYSLAYSTFANMPHDSRLASSETSTISSDDSITTSNLVLHRDPIASSSAKNAELSLLDLYSGCGAMSTGLCHGANISGVNLVTKWAVDLNKFACKSLEINHPETQVRNEKAEHFLALVREWEKLCTKYSLFGVESSHAQEIESCDSDDNEMVEESSDVSSGEFEVEKIVGICFGDPHSTGNVGLKFKVRWKGYGSNDDTWEPMDGLSNCEERISHFVRRGFKNMILPLPGMVDVICGGPPCQGISGFNRFRKEDDPLSDEKNGQLVVFMDIVEYLKPKYVLMENVVDILKFSKGFLGRYALSRLVAMHYQARLGILAAGCFGLPQFRFRCFLWGAQPSEKLPQFPLPTHNVVVRGIIPNEFEGNLCAYDEIQEPKLEKALLLEDAISDLPPVKNDESREEMPYTLPAKTEFQRFIRLTRQELGFASTVDKSTPKSKLFDHIPLHLNNDDYERVCQIPKKKGACFRDLPGVVVGADNIVKWDPNIPRVYLSSGKPLVPNYAMSFVSGKSSKPFARLWWDETVPTVVTRAEPHNQAILHPTQDRVLTVRENARLQGFPDFYKLYGPVKERYIQVGNAVAVPVSRALGYGLGLAYRCEGNDKPVFSLPRLFPRLHDTRSSPVASES